MLQEGTAWGLERLATCWQEGGNQDLAAGGDGVGFGEHRARQLFLQRAWWGKT